MPDVTKSGLNLGQQHCSYKLVKCVVEEAHFLDESVHRLWVFSKQECLLQAAVDFDVFQSNQQLLLI